MPSVERARDRPQVTATDARAQRALDDLREVVVEQLIGRRAQGASIDGLECGSDRWQRRGLGTRLLRQLVEVGRAEGVGRISGAIPADNRGMQRVCAQAGFRLRLRAEGGEYQAELRL